MIFDIERHARTKLDENIAAPGQPGDPPRWTTGAKAAVGTAVSEASRVWFTISHGIVNEVYFPSIDQANTRSLRFIVTDGQHLFSDEETDARHRVEYVKSGVPAFRITSECCEKRYRFVKEVVTDPDRDVLLMSTTFEPFANGLNLYVLLDPHVGDSGGHNEGWVGKYKEIGMLFARREETALALACSSGFKKMSAGFIGRSDGWTDLHLHKQLRWNYTEAKDGNVMLCGEIDRDTTDREFRLALAFGSHAAEAAQQARAGLLRDFKATQDKYVRQWLDKQRTFLDMGCAERNDIDLYRTSTAVLQIHESKRFPGAVVAGLSIPWGFDRGDENVAGYHVIWPRDMAQAAMGKLACGDAGSARRTVFYLQCTQEADGNWPQNMWLDGTPNWTATQMDGTAYGILLADLLRRMNELANCEPWSMIRKAAGFLVRKGPVTQQERWEENAGYSPNTMAVEIAALLAAADFADARRESELAEFLRATADAWNDCIDELTYVSGTDLSRQHKISGYYIRIAPPEAIQSGLHHDTKIRLKNKPKDSAEHRAIEVISPDILALVRFGLRAADDPRILDSVKVVDATLKTSTENGPVWHRYSDDGYGEDANGQPFDKTGIGRGWPLLVGERAHYEIARGNIDEAENLRSAIAKQTSECGMIPEQVWDAADIREHELYNGRPTGSGMPLVWAHAEYIRLLRSLKERKVWDMPPQPVERYQIQKNKAPFAIWTFAQQRGRLYAGKKLRIDCLSRAKVHWSLDNWKTANDIETTDSGLGVHYAILDAAALQPGRSVRFTFYWSEPGKWEGRDFTVDIVRQPDERSGVE
jgi:glucoamylase